MTDRRASTMHGLSRSRRIAGYGFSLVEMLVALSIFALVSGAGVILLRTSIDAQASTAKSLNANSEISRLRALLASELLSAQPRVSRDANGAPRPALGGTASSMSAVFASEGNGADSRVARATYRLSNGALIRDHADHVDGDTSGQSAIIVRDVASLSWRYRGGDGAWRSAWAPDRPDRLPLAVELTLARSGQAPLIMLFLVAPDGIPPDGQDEGDNV